MKILHTSDWHLGKKLGDFDRAEEQIEVLQEICDIAESEKVDAVIIAGDLFDTFNPPTQAVELFYKALKKLTKNGTRAVIAIAGNHDSPDRIEAPDPLARECGIIFAGYPNSESTPFELESGLKVLNRSPGFIELKIPDCQAPLRLLLTPYANEMRLKTALANDNTDEELNHILQQKWQELANNNCDEKGINLLVSHLFFVRKGAVLPEEPDDEKPILNIGGAQAIHTENIPEQIQYTALGHLHRMQQVDKRPCPVYYSGSPLSYSFAESNQEKYVLVVDLEPAKKPVLKEIELTKGKKLFRKRFETIDLAIQWLESNPDCFVELTMVTDKYITAQDQKLLRNSHKGIVTIIPELLDTENQEQENRKIIDLTKSLEQQFAVYFFHVKKQEPNEELMSLFREVIGVQDNQ